MLKHPIIYSLFLGVLLMGASESHARGRSRKTDTPAATTASTATASVTAAVPETTAPETIASETIVPEAIVPEAIVPEAIVPEETTTTITTAGLSPVEITAQLLDVPASSLTPEIIEKIGQLIVTNATEQQIAERALLVKAGSLDKETIVQLKTLLDSASPQEAAEKILELKPGSLTPKAIEMLQSMVTEPRDFQERVVETYFGLPAYSLDNPNFVVSLLTAVKNFLNPPQPEKTIQPKEIQPEKPAQTPEPKKSSSFFSRFKGFFSKGTR